MPQPLRIGARSSGQTGTYLLIVGLIAAIFAVVLGGLGWLMGSTVGERPVAGFAAAAVAVFAVAAVCVPIAALILAMRHRYAELDGTVLTVRTLTTRSADLATAPHVWLAEVGEASGYASVGRKLVPTGQRAVPMFGVRNESGGSLQVRLLGADGPLAGSELRALAKALRHNPGDQARQVRRWLRYVAEDPQRLMN